MDNLMVLIIGLFAVTFLPYLKAQRCKDKHVWCRRFWDMCDYVSDACPKTCHRCPPPKTDAPAVGPTSNPFAGECGKPEVINTRIIGGTTATRGSWPWQILLMYKGEARCGGSLIAPHWVVTAAHCVYWRERSNKWSIRVGEQDRKIKEGSEKEYTVQKVFQHPAYNAKKLNNDIALLKLRTPVIFNKYVKPICLPKREVPIGTKCYITGWGKVRHPGKMHKQLQQAVLPVVSNKECQRKNKKRLPIPVTNAMICGGDGGTSKRSGCHGDSGGPFVCKVGGVWELHGAVSHGSRRCKSTESYSVFARVFYFLKWIKSTVQKY